MVFIPQESLVFVLIVVPGLAGISLFHKFQQVLFSYELLYLLLQVPAVLCVMTVILMKMAILLLVTHVW